MVADLRRTVVLQSEGSIAHGSPVQKSRGVSSVQSGSLVAISGPGRVTLSGVVVMWIIVTKIIKNAIIKYHQLSLLLIDMHQHVLIPPPSYFAPVSCVENALSVDAVVGEGAFDHLAIGEPELPVALFAVLYKLS